jgi:hypothetical protein
MPRFFRSAIGASLVVATLVYCVVPAGARLASNRLSSNGTEMNRLASNAVTQNGAPAIARIATGLALSDLNGVAVEAVILPEAAVR